MALWSALRSNILPDVEGCPVELVDDAIRQTTIKWCEESRTWRVRSVITDAGGLALRTWPTSLQPTGSRVVGVTRCRFDGRPVSPRTSAQLDELYPGGWEALTSSRPLYLLRDREEIAAGGFRLVPAPAAATTTSLSITVALAPTEDAIGVDDFVFQQFRAPIVAGALAMLQKGAGRPWSNPGMAGANQTIFDQAADVERTKSALGSDGQPKLTRPVFF